MFLKTVTAAPLGRAGLLLLLAVLLAVHPAAAETRFIYPDLDLPVRRGAGEVYKIIKMVKDGEQVEQLELKAGWARIRTADGTEGWIEQRLLTLDQPSAQRLEAMQTENSQLRQKAGELEKSLAELNMSIAALKEHQGFEGDKTAACNAQLDALRAERRAVQDTDTAQRFLAGFGVLLLGWLLGRISAGPRRKPSRRLL